MNNDLVVFVPGILGSSLHDERGKDIFDLSPEVMFRIIKAPVSYFKDLALPQGIGDDEPGPLDSLRPGRALSGPRTFPGLISHVGHGGLKRYASRSLGERWRVFSYDWRLSNRVSAQRLGAFVERELERWARVCRERGDEQEPRVVFFCHSMGGLIARYYLDVLKGYGLARSLITVGTPHGGSLRAVQILTDTSPKLRRIPDLYRAALRKAAGTFPSIQQLLPTYKCVKGVKEVSRINSLIIRDLPTEAVEEAFRFRAELDSAREDFPDEEVPYNLFTIGGNGQPTPVFLSPGSGGRIRYEEYEDEDEKWGGDGTVSFISAMPPKVGDTDKVLWHRRVHGEIHEDNYVHHQLDNVCKAQDVGRYLSVEEGFGIDIPDAVGPEVPITVRAVSELTGLNLVASLLRPDNGKEVDHGVLKGDWQGSYERDFEHRPGMWIVRVADVTGHFPAQHTPVLVLGSRLPGL